MSLSRRYSGPTSAFRLNPLPMFADQIDQAVDRFPFGNVELNGRLPNVKIDLPRRSAHIPEIGISHFARSIHDATHNRNLHTLEMLGSLFDPSCHRLQVEQRPPAGWARDIV